MNSIYIKNIIMIKSFKNVDLIYSFLNIITNNENEDPLECSICYHSVDIFYMICKPECINYTYCKNCIDRITNEKSKCPFTNIIYKKDDICLDYRNNRKVEKQKQNKNKITKFLNTKSIKNISIEIKFN